MQKHSQEKIGFVFINGAGLEGQVWNKVVEGFDHPCLLAQFPSRNSPFDLRRSLSLEDDVKHMKRQVDEWGTHKIISLNMRNETARVCPSYGIM